MPADGDRIWVLETNLDDLPGEIVGTTTQLYGGRCLDAFVTSIQMKKIGPGDGHGPLQRAPDSRDGGDPLP